VLRPSYELDMTGRSWRASIGRERRGRVGWLAALAIGAAWLGAGPASAVSFELSWNAPPECPTAAFVEAEVARVVGRPWSELSAGWRAARARVSPSGRGYRVRVTVVTQASVDRERDVIAASCTEATEAAVAILTAGMALDDPSSAAPSAGSASTPAASAGAGTSPLDSAAPPPATVDATPVHALAGASVGVDIGTLAAVAPFVQLAGGLEWGRVSLLASVAATGRVIGELDGTSAGAQMSLLLGGFAACLRATSTNPSVGACAGIELGSLEARGIGTVDGLEGRAFWSASLARASLDWTIGGASVVSIGATGVVPFRHLRVISSPEEVHRTPSVAIRPCIGLGLRFK
jgi:hypothetical protein